MSQQAISLLALTVGLTGAAAANRFITPAGAQAGAGANTLGVTRSAGSIGEKVPVDVIGTAVVEAGAAITQGDTLKVDANGKAITWAVSGAKVAIALQAAGADGALIEVLLLPNA
ncbi:DUF2190 family protein [Azonexus sp.]|uniref:DUF2190 family protein n=1 Tax=Azonexus sp. TaxID=1872668 RepID=UPI0027BA7456|nr:DUF2190 family protein [Azonexus sp.]